MEAFVIYHNTRKMFRLMYNTIFIGYFASVALQLDRVFISNLMLLTFMLQSTLLVFKSDKDKLGSQILGRSLVIYVIMFVTLVLEMIYGPYIKSYYYIFIADVIFLLLNKPTI